MTTRPLADFLPHVLPHAKGCPHIVAEQQLRLAAIEWCERTRGWRHLAKVAVVANQATVVAPDYATVHEIETAEFIANGATQGYPLDPLQFTQVDLDNLEPDQQSGPPAYITQTQPNSVLVLPSASGTLNLSLFLKPRSGSEFGGDPHNPLQDQYNVVPEHMFIQSAEQIAHGALARLLKIKDEPWTDLQMAAHFEAKFDDHMDRRFSNHMKGQQRARVRTRPHYF